MKNFCSLLIALAIVFTSFTPLVQASSPNSALNASVPNIDTQKADKGVVGVSYSYKGTNRLKVIVQKGQEKYTYDFDGDGRVYHYPLQLGKGEYQIGLLEQVKGTNYKYLLKKTVDYSPNNAADVYLNSIQLIDWSDDALAVKKARELTKDLTNDQDKLNAIYDYVVKNYNYDKEKPKKVPAIYYPNIDSTYREGSGMCYDFSSLFASMLRSVGIPTKLVKGYADKIVGYHAWNEVYIQNKWMVIDTTYDAQLRAAKVPYTIYKPEKSYNKTSEY